LEGRAVGRIDNGIY